MNNNIWRIIELICYILKLIIDNHDTRTTKPQPTEHPKE